MMLLLQFILQLLNIFELMLDPSFVLLLALAAFCPEQLIFLPLLIKVARPAINSPPPPRPRTPHLDETICHPSLPLRNFAHIILKQHISTLPPHLRTKYSPYLHGAAFASVAANLFTEKPSQIVREMGLEVDDVSKRRARFLASLPEIVETGPEDGNRLPEPGQRESRERVVVGEGRLKVPRVVPRVRRREVRRKKKELERAREA